MVLSSLLNTLSLIALIITIYFAFRGHGKLAEVNDPNIKAASRDLRTVGILLIFSIIIGLVAFVLGIILSVVTFGVGAILLPLIPIISGILTIIFIIIAVIHAFSALSKIRSSPNSTVAHENGGYLATILTIVFLIISIALTVISHIVSIVDKFRASSQQNTNIVIYEDDTTNNLLQ